MLDVRAHSVSRLLSQQVLLLALGEHIVESQTLFLGPDLLEVTTPEVLTVTDSRQAAGKLGRAEVHGDEVGGLQDEEEAEDEEGSARGDLLEELTDCVATIGIDR